MTKTFELTEKQIELVKDGLTMLYEQRYDEALEEEDRAFCHNKSESVLKRINTKHQNRIDAVKDLQKVFG